MTATAIRQASGLDRTGALLADGIEFGFLDESPTHTRLILGSVDNPVLREVLPAWESTLSMASIASVTRPSPVLADAAAAVASVVRVSLEALAGGIAVWLSTAPATPETLSAHDAVGYVASRLGMPVTAVLRAAGVVPRTYYSWLALGVRQPRLPSQGSLWKLVQITQDLDDLLGADLKPWMRVDPQRRVLLERRKLDRLLALALVERSTESPGSTARIWDAVGTDLDVPRLSASEAPDRARRPRRLSYDLPDA